MTVTQTPEELEAYAARAMREGRYADAESAYRHAAAQNKKFTPAQQTQAKNDALLQAAAALGSHVPAGYPQPQMSFLLASGSFALTGAIRQTYVGGTAANLGASGSITARPAWPWAGNGRVGGAGGIVAKAGLIATGRARLTGGGGLEHL